MLKIPMSFLPEPFLVTLAMMAGTTFAVLLYCGISLQMLDDAYDAILLSLH
jgi:hypothetical protein